MFDDLHDPAPPSPDVHTLAAVAARAQRLRRHRSLIAGAWGVGVAVLVLVSLAAFDRPPGRVAPAIVDPSTSVLVPESTSEPSPDTSSPSVTTTSSTTVPTSAVTAEDPCLDVPAPPPWLLDGSAPGEATVVLGQDGSVSALWGVEGSAAEVWQAQPDPSVDWFLSVEGTDQLVTSGQVRAAVVPIGDGAIGMIRIAVSDESCDREYGIGPGVELSDAVSFAQDWVDALAAWDSLTISEGVSDICASVASTGSSACVLAGPGPVAATGQSDLDGTSLALVLAVGAQGTALAEPSSLAQSQSVAGTPNTLVIDVIRRDACGAVQFPDSTSLPVGFGCAGPAPTRPSPDPAAVWSEVVAIDGSGDAVVFDSSANPTVVLAGTDPDDPLPPEGPVTFIDGLAVAPGRSEVVVGVCCEPSAGALWRHDQVGGEGLFITYGHLPALTSYGNLVWYALGPVLVGGLDGSIAMTLLELDPAEWTVIDLAVIQRGSEPEEVLLLATRADGTYLWRVFAAGGDMQLSQKISDAVTTRRELSLAGWRDDAFYVLDGKNDRMLAFRAKDLQPTTSDVRTSDGEVVRWRSAWITPTAPRHVDENGELWFGDSSWGGDYIWVR